MNEEDYLLEKELITDEQHLLVKKLPYQFSLFWEVRTILYCGILLLTSGLGFLIYKNIDTIGHQVIIGIIALLTLGCYYYCFKHSPSYTPDKVQKSTWSDYVLLLGCLLFLSLETYLQFQYQVFGTRYGIATIIPAILFVPLAYRFDHVGVLSLGLTSLAAWIGVTVNPYEYITNNDFQSDSLTWSAFVFGVLLVITGTILDRQNVKKHFTFTYFNFAIHLIFISTLVGTFSVYPEGVFSLLFLLSTAGFYFYSIKHHSFYFLLFTFIYGYIGITYIIFHWILSAVPSDAIFFFAFLYTMGSAGLVVAFFINYKKILKIK